MKNECVERLKARERLNESTCAMLLARLLSLLSAACCNMLSIDLKLHCRLLMYPDKAEYKAVATPC